MQDKHREAEAELDRRQESYMRREDQLRAQLADVQQQLHEATAGGSSAAEPWGQGAGGDDTARDVKHGSRAESLVKGAAAKAPTLQEMQQQVGMGEGHADGRQGRACRVVPGCNCSAQHC